MKNSTINNIVYSPPRTINKSVIKSSTKKTPSKLVKKLDVFYDHNGILHYIGETKDGLAHGKGKLFHSNGSLEYEGSFRKNLLHGKGVQSNDKGRLIYKGSFKSGIRQGSCFQP